MNADRSPDRSEDSLTVMFLNVDMKRIRTGIENSALLRAKVFERHLGIVPQILTVNYDAHFAETRDELLRAGLVTEGIVFRNLYQSFQHAECETGSSESSNGQAAPTVDSPTGGVERALLCGVFGDGQECPSYGDPTVIGAPIPTQNRDWRYAPVAGTADWRVYDGANQLLMYCKTSRQTGSLEYINFFDNHKMWRRDTFDTGGWLSRIQFLDTETNTALYEHYHRPDGSVAVIQRFTRIDGERRLTKIQILNRQGFCTQEFRNQADWITFWLQSLTVDAERRFVMIVDKNRVYHDSLRKLKDSPEYQHNVVVVPVIHAVHTKNGFDVRHSKTNSNYASILENLKSQDAVVVLTEKQKQDITERYGPGNIHVIPHPYEAVGEAVPFENRDRYLVVYLGRYSEEKNQAAAIRAFVKVVRAIPQAKLQLFGNGSGKAALQALVKQLMLESCVAVNDFVLDVAAIYESAGLLLLTSRGEGFSLVILESLCHGCPVVAFDVNYGPTDMIEEGRNGFLVPFGDEALLAQRIIEVLSAPERHEQLCAQARRSAKQFANEPVAARWKALMRVGNSAAPP